MILCALPVLLAACSTAGGSDGDASPVAHEQVTVPHSAAEVVVQPGDGARQVRPDAPVRIVAVDGVLSDVTITPRAGGQPLPGRLSADGRSWTLTQPLLPLSHTFVVRAQAIDSQGYGKLVQTTFTTVKPAHVLNTIVTPNDQVVGVGMPLMVRFTAPVKDRAAVEARLDIETSKPVVGGWYWVSDEEVHYRPRSYWPVGTVVTGHLRLNGVFAGDGVWGDHDRTIQFTVGDAMVSTVDIGKHTMTVTRNGQVLRVIPVTTGKPSFDTRLGTKVIVSLQRNVIMDSATVDIPANSPDQYRLNVEYAMRLTWSGEFVHAAPWSVSSQGHANVSHGCTGMSLENAAWLFNMSKVGDVVNYVDGWRPLEPWNGYTDWNIPWSKWKQGSAL